MDVRRTIHTAPQIIDFAAKPLKEILGSPTGVAANAFCTSEHDLKERSDAQIIVSR